jgi:NitT/TauT family transport system substrate-binding protein
MHPGRDESDPGDSNEEGEMGGRKRKGIIFLALAAAVLLSALSMASCTKPAVPEKKERLVIGVFPDTISALTYIAQDQGFFRRYGLDVSFEKFQTGAYAVNDLLADKVDAATASGFVLALQGFKRPDLRAIAAISSAENVEIVARRDHGIEKASDLRGKRIGVGKGTVNDFFLSAFLSLNNILPGEVQTINLKVADVVTALTEGKIDAVVCFPPYSETVKKDLGRDGVSWPIQGGQGFYFLLIVKADLIKTRPRAVDSLLKGALDAEDFFKKHESEARTIVERSLGLDRAAIASSWSRIHFRVGLDQALLTLMEDEGRWAIQNKLVATQKVPNYLNLLYLNGLEKLRPDAVSVVH